MKAGIVGGGIMGQLLALVLMNANWQVSLFDDGKESCSQVAAGLLTPIAELENSDPVIYELGLISLKKYWPELLNFLKEPIYFRNQGSLLLSHPRDKGELVRFLKIISHKIPDQTIHPLSDDTIKIIEPELSHFDEGYYIENEGQIDNQSLLLVLKNHLFTQGVIWHQTSVEEIKPHEIVLVDKTLQFDMVFDCRGLRSTFFKNELRGVRGELIWLHHPDIDINHPVRLLHPRYQIYLSPRPNRTYIIGASEIESEDNSPISVKTLLELLSATYYIHPNFAEARLIKTMTHCRPTLTNHLPKIKWMDGLIAINGLYRHGFLIAPAIANDVMRFLARGFSSILFPKIWEKT